MALVRMRNKNTNEIKYKPAGYAQVFKDTWELAPLKAPRTTPPVTEAPVQGKKEVK